MIKQATWLDQHHHIFFIGIGGVGMSALALYLKSQGFEVSGSDAKESGYTTRLRAAGIKVFLGHQAGRMSQVDLVVYSSAIKSDHVEYREAALSGISICHRSEILAAIMNRMETVIAVSGTHGKTTTSSMISYVLKQAGKKPTSLIGGDLMNEKSNVLIGDNAFCVAEVDESDGTHERYAPHYAVVTNLEEDHMDFYKSLADIGTSFGRFLGNLKDPGVLIYSSESPLLRQIVHEGKIPAISFGFDAGADFSADNIVMEPFGSSFDLVEAGLYSTPVQLGVPGRHNVANALACLAMVTQIGIDPAEAAAILKSFRGARRRLEIKGGSREEGLVVDDYAHHPTEILAGVRALNGMGCGLTVVFQPHRFSRTRHFFREIAQSLTEAEEVILTEVYAAGEKETGGESRLIFDELKRRGHRKVVLLAKDEIVPFLEHKDKKRRVFGFLGAGDIGEVADAFASRLQNFATT